MVQPHHGVFLLGNAFFYMIDRVRRAMGAKKASAGNLAMLERLFMQALDNRTVGPKEGDVQGAIINGVVDESGNHYPSVVLLDTDFFDGLSPRNWGKKLREYVESRSENNPLILPVEDENGNVQQIQFAEKSDRVEKDGHTSHRVINKLYRTTDNISKLAVVHIDEILTVSEEGNPYYTSENNHQWLDEKGWLHRTAHIVNAKNGAIYQITVDIAKARDGRHILYATDGKIKRVGNAQVSSLTNRGSKQNPNSDTNVAQKTPGVNTHSMQEGAGVFAEDGGNSAQGALLPPEYRPGARSEGVDPNAESGAETPSVADGDTSLREGGLRGLSAADAATRGVEGAAPYSADSGAVQVDEAAVLESAVRSQPGYKKGAQQTTDGISPGATSEIEVAGTPTDSIARGEE